MYVRVGYHADLLESQTLNDTNCSFVGPGRLCYEHLAAELVERISEYYSEILSVKETGLASEVHVHRRASPVIVTDNTPDCSIRVATPDCLHRRRRNKLNPLA